MGTTEEVSKRIREELEKAHKLLGRQGDAAEVSRVLRRFALVLVAGWLACDAGVLPFSRADITEGVRVVRRRWLEVHGRGPMDRAVEQLRAFILRNENRFRDRRDPNQVVRDLVGYRDRPQELFLLTPDGAKEALEGHSTRDVMRHLAKEGLLVSTEKGRLMSGHRISGIDRVVRLYAIYASLVGEEGGEQGYFA
jgi:putative DNA primase/helicase